MHVCCGFFELLGATVIVKILQTIGVTSRCANEFQKPNYVICDQIEPCNILVPYMTLDSRLFPSFGASSNHLATAQQGRYLNGFVQPILYVEDAEFNVNIVLDVLTCDEFPGIRLLVMRIAVHFPIF